MDAGDEINVTGESTRTEERRKIEILQKNSCDEKGYRENSMPNKAMLPLF